jgi:hypothetical protein
MPQLTSHMTEGSDHTSHVEESERQRIAHLLALALPYVSACEVGNPAARQLARAITAELQRLDLR